MNDPAARTSLPPPYTERMVSCPRCGGLLVRVHRRWIDRVISLLRPVRRYRCRSLHCRWEGNLPGRR